MVDGLGGYWGEEFPDYTIPNWFLPGSGILLRSLGKSRCIIPGSVRGGDYLYYGSCFWQDELIATSRVI